MVADERAESGAVSPARPFDQLVLCRWPAHHSWVLHRELRCGSLARAVGMNHVALEVGSVDEALAFYGRLFEVELRERIPGAAFVDMGDQFLA